jgi:hypothetical protein
VAAGQWSKLLGVSCVDMNIIVDLPTLEAPQRRRPRRHIPSPHSG